MKEFIKGANPYMPLWEHVPDGEPRVFEYNGEKRVYLYGSHDTLKTEYCGPDQVVWSAPVDDLTNWTCHGVCYTSTDGSILYAPDVVQKGDTFYMYAAEAKGSRIMLATSKNPAGPFTNPKLTELAFDPGILVDDDGRVYAFWGFCKQYCAELNDDMLSVKKETITHMTPQGGNLQTWAFREGAYVFYRKGTYYFMWSVDDTGSPNYHVCYGTAKSPLGPITIDENNYLVIKQKPEDGIYGTAHNSVLQIPGKDEWYIVYHRINKHHLHQDPGIHREVCIDKLTFDKKGKIIPVTPTLNGPEPLKH